MERLLEVTLKRSRIGVSKHQLKTLDALGLRKINQKKVFKDNKAIRGMINRVEHLITVKEVEK